jgi:predicted patatin/cPLA2 family phospholipase
MNWIMASSSFPIFFPMEKIEDEYWTDGGVNDMAPLFDAVSLGATEIDVILASPIKLGLEKKLGLPTQILRTLDILSSEILKNDLKICKANAKVRIIMPEKPAGVGSLSFSPEGIRKLYKEGQKAAEKLLAENK